MEKTERDRDKDKDRKIKRGREMEREQGKGRQRQSEAKKEIKTAGMGRAKDRGESPLLQSLQPGFPRVWAPLAFLWFP